MAETKSLKGLLKAEGLRCVQHGKRTIGDVGDYFYNLCFSTGEDIILITSGKIADKLELNKVYDLGLDFIDKKLKLVDFKLVG